MKYLGKLLYRDRVLYPTSYHVRQDLKKTINSFLLCTESPNGIAFDSLDFMLDILIQSVVRRNINNETDG